MPKLIMSFLAALLWGGVLAAATLAAEPRIVFLVRHAERADAGGPGQPDPDLSETGRSRATALVGELRDAGVKTIFTTELKRTQETAAPLAKALGMKIETVPAKDVSGLVTKLKKGVGNVLVVGHSNTLPEIMKGLGVSAAVTIRENDYDDLFFVVLDREPTLIHLHYR